MAKLKVADIWGLMSRLHRRAQKLGDLHVLEEVLASDLILQDLLPMVRCPSLQDTRPSCPIPVCPCINQCQLFFLRESGEPKVMMASHVDDLIYACLPGYEHVMNNLQKAFQVELQRSQAEKLDSVAERSNKRIGSPVF